MRRINPSQRHENVPDQRGFFYGWRRERLWFGPLVQKIAWSDFSRTQRARRVRRRDAPHKSLCPIYSQLQTLPVPANEYIESFETERFVMKLPGAM